MKNVTLNSFCASKFSSDSSWYRAKIININKQSNLLFYVPYIFSLIIIQKMYLANKASVFYIDYGNSEELAFEDLRKLDGQFYVDPPLAIPLSLANVFKIKFKLY